MKKLRHLAALVSAAVCLYFHRLKREGRISSVPRLPLCPAAWVEDLPPSVIYRQTRCRLLQEGPWKAKEFLKQSLRAGISWNLAGILLIHLLERCGEAGRALHELDLVAEKYGDTEEWLHLRACALRRLGHTEEALGLVKKGCTRYPLSRKFEELLPKLSREMEYVEKTLLSYRGSEAWARIRELKDIHKGKRCFIIGNGPSLKGQDLLPLRNEITFVSNWFANHPDCVRIMPTFYCVCSHDVFGGWDAPRHQLHEGFKKTVLSGAPDSRFFFSYKFKGLLESDPEFREKKLDYLIFDSPKKSADYEKAINIRLDDFMFNGFTVINIFCLPLAFHMGFSEIYLLGCDCDYALRAPEAPKSYFYDHTKHATQTTGFERLMQVWADGGSVFQAYEAARFEAERRGVRIYNATGGGRLEVFPRVNYGTLISERKNPQ